MISIAVPAHNEEESIQTSLKHIASSDFKNEKYEIVVCLSACSDNTENKILEFKEKNPTIPVKIIESKEKGKVRAYKKLDDYIKNNIIIFTDSDCASEKDAIYKIYSDLKKSSSDIKIVSGNAIDPRYTDRKTKPANLMEAFNYAFWQRSPRKIINGQFFAERKGSVQIIPNDIKLDDVYMSIYYWNNFTKNNDAIIIQGSGQSLYEIIRYQKNVTSGKKQIEEYLGKKPDFKKTTKFLYGQFYINLNEKNKYYPNINYFYLVAIQIMTLLGEIWGILSKPTWDRTAGSKKLAVS